MEAKTAELLTQEFISSPGSFHPHPVTAILSVACSDRDYRQALAEFHARFEQAGLDRIVEPGGPQVLSLESADLAIKRVRFLVNQHGISAVVLIGHHKCGAYAAVYEPQGWSQEQIDEQVKTDLRAVGRGLLEAFGNSIRIYLFFAEPVGDRVRFTPLT